MGFMGLLHCINQFNVTALFFEKDPFLQWACLHGILASINSILQCDQTFLWDGYGLFLLVQSFMMMVKHLEVFFWHNISLWIIPLGGDFIHVVSKNWFLTPILGECVCCTPLVLLVLIVVIKLWAYLQYIVVIKNISEVLFNNEFCCDYGGLGNIYVVYFIPRYTILTFLSIILWAFELTNVCFSLSPFLTVKFFISESLGIFKTPSIYGIWIHEIIIYLCMCNIAISNLGLARIFSTYQHFLEHKCW